MGRSTPTIPVLGIALAILAAAGSGQTVLTGIQYAAGNGVRHQLDVYLPAAPSASPAPCVVWIHGGGWWSGDKSQAAGDALELAAQGFAVVAINYRYSTTAPWPAQIHDCKAAVRWIRGNAAGYGIDAARIAAFGPSAGGHLAAMLAVTGNEPSMEGTVGAYLAESSAVVAAAEFAAETDLFLMPSSAQTAGSRESTLLGIELGTVVQNLSVESFATWVSLALSVSPMTFLDAADAPLYVAHGTADAIIPMAQSEALFDAAVAAGLPAEFRVVPGAGHTLPAGENGPRTLFLKRHLMVEALPGIAPVLSAPAVLGVGGTASLAVAGGAPGDPAGIWVAPSAGFVPLPGAGTALIDLGTLGVVAVGACDGSGAFAAGMTVPADPALATLNVYFQAAIISGGTVEGARLSGTLVTHLLP